MSDTNNANAGRDGERQVDAQQGNGTQRKMRLVRGGKERARRDVDEPATSVKNVRPDEFTDEEKAIYERDHLPMRDKAALWLEEMRFPIICLLVIAMAVVFVMIKSYSSAILIVGAMVLAIILMGLIVFYSYRTYKETNELADMADDIYNSTQGIMSRENDDDDDSSRSERK